MDMRGFQTINARRAKEWHDGDINSWSLNDWMVAMAGECGEACNVAKKIKRMQDGIVGNSEPGHVLQKALAEELADTVTYAFIAAERSGINLEEAIIEKFNAVSRKHQLPYFIGRKPL